MTNLNTEQEAIADQFMLFMTDPSQHYMIIKGAAGTGKTFLVKELIQRIANQAKILNLVLHNDSVSDHFKVVLTAPTHKAAKVLGETVGIDARTIHSVLGVKVRNNHKTGGTVLQQEKHYSEIRKELSRCLLIVDEFSYIDEGILKLLTEHKEICKILFVGDEKQLKFPNSRGIPVLSLPHTENALVTPMRSGEELTDLGSSFRKAISDHLVPSITPVSNKIHVCSGAEFKQHIDAHFLTGNEADKEEFKILAWTNERVQQYNEYVQKLKGYNHPLQVGSTYISNDPVIYNNELLVKTDQLITIHSLEKDVQHDIEGHWVTLKETGSTHFAPDNAKEMKQLLKYYYTSKRFREMFAIKENWLDIRPLHASTVHKSQGSTYKKVFVDLDDIARCNVDDDYLRMLYVAVTRASKEIYFYGSLKPLR